MVTYVGLMNFTDKGLQSIKDTTKRAAAAKEAAKKAAFSLATAMQGNVRFQSLRAYSSSEMDAVLAKIP